MTRAAVFPKSQLTSINGYHERNAIILSSQLDVFGVHLHLEPQHRSPLRFNLNAVHFRGWDRRRTCGDSRVCSGMRETQLSGATERLVVPVIASTRMSFWLRRVLLAIAILVALLPLVEVGDKWESYGSDPEFVNVITVLAVAGGFLLFRREIATGLRRFRILPRLIRRSIRIPLSSVTVIQDSLPLIRSPIRI